MWTAPFSPHADAPVTWLRTLAADERDESAQWAAAVGPPLFIADPSPAARPVGTRCVVVSWNTHVGGGDVQRLVSDIRTGRLTGHVPNEIILLLQEVYRSGDPVPREAPRASHAAARQAPVAATGNREEIVATARRLGMSAFYVPSMRNGVVQEDRGNAILATVPLRDPLALELPLESQRRVAVGVTATLPSHGTVHLFSTHFTNMVARRLWLFAEPGRVRQARALRGVLPPGPLILGGDLNSWFGYHDAAYRELASALGPEPASDRRSTFGPMRLDHLFLRIGAGAPQVRRLDDRYGSDHYPLLAELR